MDLLTNFFKKVIGLYEKKFFFVVFLTFIYIFLTGLILYISLKGEMICQCPPSTINTTNFSNKTFNELLLDPNSKGSEIEETNISVASSEIYFWKPDNTLARDTCLIVNICSVSKQSCKDLIALGKIYNFPLTLKPIEYGHCNDGAYSLRREGVLSAAVATLCYRKIETSKPKNLPRSFHGIIDLNNPQIKHFCST